MEILEKVFDVFGDELPTRNIYGATVAKPVSTKAILKEFKTWPKFRVAYLAYVVSKRNEAAKAKVVTKPVGVQNVTKK